MGGFSAMIGNPPWSKPRLLDKEWWVGYPEIANAKSSTRKKKIQQMKSINPQLVETYEKDLLENNRLRKFLGSVNYPLCGHGNLNLYGIFAELCTNSAKTVGIITQTNLVTDTTTHRWFKEMIHTKRISSITDFVNKKQIFPGIADNTRFSLIYLGLNPDDLKITANNVSIEEFNKKTPYIINAELVERINGMDYTCPIFSSKTEFDFVIDIIENGQRFGEPENGWNAQFGRMVDMSNDSSHFRTFSELEKTNLVLNENDFVWRGLDGKTMYIPLYEAKLFDAFNPRHGDFRRIEDEKKFGVKAQPAKPSREELDNKNWSPHPRYWVPIDLRDDWLEKRNSKSIGLGNVATRDICRGLVESRSLKAVVLPHSVALGNTGNYWLSPNSDPAYPWVLSAVMNSLISDFQARMKLTGIHLSKYILEQLFFVTPGKLRDTYVYVDGKNYETAWFQLLVVSRALHKEWTHLQHPLDTLPPWLVNEPNPMAILDVITAKIMGLNEEKFSWLLDQFPIWERQLGEQTFRNDRISWFKRIEIIRSRQDVEKINVERLLSGNENLHVEYKQTIKEPREGGSKLDTKNSFIKAVIGMANHQGGYVVVGVKEEDGNAVPVGFDTKYVNDADKAQVTVTQVIEETSAYAATLIDPKVHSYNDLKVLVIKIKPSASPIYCDLGDGEKFYCRLPNKMAKKLKGEQLEFYLKDRFNL